MKSSKLLVNLQYLMKEKSLSANHVATSCGIKASTLSRFLNGDISAPRTSTIVALANFFNLTPAQLVDADVSSLPKIRPPVTNDTLRSSLVPLVTGQGASALHFADLWPYPDPLHELSPISWLPPPPDKALLEEVSTKEEKILDQGLFAFNVENSSAAPLICKGDIAYFISIKYRQCRDGDIVLVRSIKEIYRSEHAKEKQLTLEEIKNYLYDEADFLIRRLIVSDNSSLYLSVINPDWPEQGFTKLNLGDGFGQDQILGIAVGKYSRIF